MRPALGLCFCLASLLPVAGLRAETDGRRNARLMDVLVATYPDHLRGHDGTGLLWRDGTRMQFDDGNDDKPFEKLLDEGDAQDQFYRPYPRGPMASPPAVDVDPGRVRNERFFIKMYGDCRSGGVERDLVDVVWLPSRGGSRVPVTRINGVAERLRAVSEILDRLPDAMTKYVRPIAGTFNCRTISGTTRLSPHAYAIAVDINVKFSDYWRWRRPGPGSRVAYRNRIPQAIVDAFEANGFIWGGKWYHYDTMHFEYRPELLRAP